MNELIEVLDSMQAQHINKRMDYTTASFDHIKDLQRRLQAYSKRYITTQSIINLIIEHHAQLMGKVMTARSRLIVQSENRRNDI